MNTTLGSSAAEASTASPDPEPPRYEFRNTQARQARRAPAQQVHPTPTTSRPTASHSKRKRNQDDDRGNAVAQPGAASRASKKPRLAITQTKGRPANLKEATIKKTRSPLKQADEAHKRAREEKEKMLQRERAREERNQRYERRRASAEERQRAQPLQTAGPVPSTPEDNQPEASSPPQSVSARDKGKGREVPVDDRDNPSHREGQAAAPVAASTSTSTSTSTSHNGLFSFAKPTFGFSSFASSAFPSSSANPLSNFASATSQPSASNSTSTSTSTSTSHNGLFSFAKPTFGFSSFTSSAFPSSSASPLSNYSSATSQPSSFSSIFTSTSTSAPPPTFQPSSVWGAETMARLAREEAPVSAPVPSPVQPGIRSRSQTRYIAIYRMKNGENTLQTEEEQRIFLAEMARRGYS